MASSGASLAVVCRARTDKEVVVPMVWPLCSKYSRKVLRTRAAGHWSSAIMAVDVEKGLR